MLTIERHPSPILTESREVVLVEPRPDLRDWLSSDESLHSLCVVFIGILTVFEDVEHIVEALLELGFHGLVVGGCISQCERGEIVTSHMPLERPAAESPVGERWMGGSPVVVLSTFLSESRFPDERCEEPIDIVLQEKGVVGVHRLFER